MTSPFGDRPSPSANRRSDGIRIGHVEFIVFSIPLIAMRHGKEVVARDMDLGNEANGRNRLRGLQYSGGERR